MRVGKDILQQLLKPREPTIENGNLLLAFFISALADQPRHMLVGTLDFYLLTGRDENALSFLQGASCGSANDVSCLAARAGRASVTFDLAVI